MPPNPTTKDQFLDFLAQKFRDRAHAFLQATQATSGAWSQTTLQTLFKAVNDIPSPSSLNAQAVLASLRAALKAMNDIADFSNPGCPNGGDVTGACQYQIGADTFCVVMTCSQCQALGGQFFEGHSTCP